MIRSRNLKTRAGSGGVLLAAVRDQPLLFPDFDTDVFSRGRTPRACGAGACRMSAEADADKTLITCGVWYAKERLGRLD